MVLLDKRLRDDGGDDGTGRLARPKGVERADGDHGQVVSAIKTFGQFIGADLAGRVGGLSLQGMFLVNGSAAGGAIDLAGGGVDQARDTQFAAGHQHIERAHEVDLSHFVRMAVGVRDGDQSPEMEDQPTVPRGLENRLAVAQVTGNHFQAFGQFGGQKSQEARVAARVVAHKGAHTRTFCQQGFHQLTADEAACAGHKNSLIFPVHVHLN